MFVKPTIDESTWDDLETALLTADFGPDISERIVDELREKVDRYRTTDPRDLQRMLKETLEEHFAKFDTTLRLTERPAVVLVVGVNGVGKTTTIGKFAKFLQRYGRSVVVGAADTFRAAAVDQLATWAERGGATIVRPQHEGQDPASVAYQTIDYTKAHGIEIVLVDTAGRLHTKGGLMDEFTKIRRVIEKPRHLPNRLKGCGLYFFDLPVFEAVSRTPRTAMRDEYELTDSIQILIDYEYCVRVAPVVQWDINVTYIDDLIRCSCHVLEKAGQRRIVGENCQLAPGVELIDTVLGDNVRISRPVRLERCVVLGNVDVATDRNYADSVIAADGVLRLDEDTGGGD